MPWPYQARPRVSISRCSPLGVGHGDEVIQPALNFVAAANMTVAVGAIPVFADICGLDEPTIDPNEANASFRLAPKAVVVMH
jgi:dTDP-4-amino-4,6-dideoxygalactose transaminase